MSKKSEVAVVYFDDVVGRLGDDTDEEWFTCCYFNSELFDNV